MFFFLIEAASIQLNPITARVRENQDSLLNMTNDTSLESSYALILLEFTKNFANLQKKFFFAKYSFKVKMLAKKC